MSERVAIDHTPDGRLVAVKRSRGPADEQRLRHEAVVLERARHPGVVELVHLDEDERGLALLTLVVADGSLERRTRPEVPQVAALAASLATTLADLHAMGIVHGRIDPSHVLVGRGGRPTLCGFAEASLPDDEQAAEDAPRWEGEQPTPAVDVAGLGRLVHSLLAEDTELEPIPELRRRLRRPRRPGWTGYQHRALLTLADQASADDPAHRPTARAFAAALSAAFPDAVLQGAGARSPAPHGPVATAATALDAHIVPTGPVLADAVDDGAGIVADAPAPGPRAHARRLLVAAGAVLAGVLGLTALSLGAGSLRGGPRPEVVADASPASTPSAPSTTTVGSEVATGDEPDGGGSTTTTTGATTPAPAASEAVSCAEASGPVADLDGDGCLEAVHAEGTVVTTDAGRFQVGDDGDEVALGDWDCDGAATPAVLRPSTGDVFAFERWAGPEGDLSTVAVDQVDGATGLQVEAEGECDRLVVTSPSGQTEVDTGGHP